MLWNIKRCPWQDVNNKRGGKLERNYLLNANNMYEGVANKVADIGLSSTTYEPGRFPLLDISDMPSGYPNAKAACQVVNDLVKSYPPDTPTESGAFGSFGAIILALGMRKLSWENFRLSMASTLRSSAMVILLIVGAMVFGRFLTLTRLPFAVAEWVVSLAISSWVVRGRYGYGLPRICLFPRTLCLTHRTFNPISSNCSICSQLAQSPTGSTSPIVIVY